MKAWLEGDGIDLRAVTRLLSEGDVRVLHCPALHRRSEMGARWPASRADHSTRTCHTPHHPRRPQSQHRHRSGAAQSSAFRGRIRRSRIQRVAGNRAHSPSFEL